MESEIKLYTIGFTKKSAAQFFSKLKIAGAKRIVDVRLNNSSQLAGFAKQSDLVFFLKEINGMDYVHLPELAPTKDILDAYKKHKGDWGVYEVAFMELMRKREIEKRVDPEVLEQGCLLCSEHEPHHCHRRLVAEYLNEEWGGGLTVSHLT
jgi:uncharacterized protein (DUF488 family)